MKKYQVALIGYGNVGRYALEAIQAAPDMELVAIVEQKDTQIDDLKGMPIINEVADLPPTDVALICIPSRFIESMALDLLGRGINTVDAFDIHPEIVDLRKTLDKEAKKNNAVAIVSAGWEPGTNSMIRTIMEFMAPQGITYTNFGPGMSMGHSVAAKAIEGVADALSITIPKGEGLHRRMVYVQSLPGVDFQQLKTNILQDDYFSQDETHVFQVGDIKQLLDMGHGVTMERKGVAGKTHNQLFKYEMRVNNPALTSQIMVAAGRASFFQNPGAKTMIEIPLIDFLYGDRDQLIRKFV